MGAYGNRAIVMRFLRFFLSGLWLCALTAHAGLPDYQVFPAAGQRLLLWVASERGRTAPELAAAQQLAERGVAVWSLDPANAYFLPQVPSSMAAYSSGERETRDGICHSSCSRAGTAGRSSAGA